MRVRSILRFLLILLVSILFSVSSRFCDFSLLQFTMRKNILNTVWGSDSVQQERLSVNIEVVKEVKKTVNASQDRYNIPSC